MEEVGGKKSKMQFSRWAAANKADLNEALLRARR